MAVSQISKAEVHCQLWEKIILNEMDRMLNLLNVSRAALWNS